MEPIVNQSSQTVTKTKSKTKVFVAVALAAALIIAAAVVMMRWSVIRGPNGMPTGVMSVDQSGVR